MSQYTKLKKKKKCCDLALHTVQSVGSIHQYSRFFRKELSILRFQFWDLSQMNGQLISHSIGVFTNNGFLNLMLQFSFLRKFCEMATIAQKPLLFQKRGILNTE